MKALPSPPPASRENHHGERGRSESERSSLPKRVISISRSGVRWPFSSISLSAIAAGV